MDRFQVVLFFCVLLALLPAFNVVVKVHAEVSPSEQGKVETNLKAERIPLKTDDDVIRREEEAMSPDGYSVSELKQIREQAQKYQFQAEVNKVMSIIINSLYSNKDIFLRELVSNASDALDKVRFLSLTDPSQLGEDHNLAIRIKYDQESRQLHIIDNGVGMTKEDLVSKLGTIAQSGTKEFAEALAKDDLNLIGQFGVGFYSAFLVADVVTVTSKHNSDKQWVWESTADNTFSISEDPRGNTLGRGTRVTLHLKEDADDYLNQAKLEELIAKYSEFINFPIYLWASSEQSSEVPDEEATEEEDVSLDDQTTEKKAKTKTISTTQWDWKLLNAQKPIWMRSPSEITDEEYSKFYASFTKDSIEPLAHIHFTGEGEFDFRSILFIPSKAPENQFNADYALKNKNLKLYVKRVFISDSFAGELPAYIGFIKGIIDSENLPLNVSREILQQDKNLTAIKRKIIRKAIAMIQTLAEDPEKYARFYEQYGTNLKMGVIDDSANRTRLSKLLKFYSSKTHDLTSFDDYVSRMKKDQKQIYYLAGESVQAVEKSPFLEKLLKKGFEVLYLTDPIDEWCLGTLNKYDNKYPLTNIAKEGLTLDGESEDLEKVKEVEEDYKPLTDFLKQRLSGRVSKVAVSKLLVKTPSSITSGVYGVSANMERLMKAQAFVNPQQLNMMKSQRTLEINPRHSIIAELNRRIKLDQSDPVAADIADLLYETAALHSGYTLENPAEFAGRIHRMMKLSLNIESEEVLEEPEPVDEPTVEDTFENVQHATSSGKDEL